MDASSAGGYRVARTAGPCQGNDGSPVRSESECMRACRELPSKGYSANEWDHSPGCFFSSVNGNCHWNRKSPDLISWKTNGEVCRTGDVWELGNNNNDPYPLTETINHKMFRVLRV